MYLNLAFAVGNLAVAVWNPGDSSIARAVSAFAAGWCFAFAFVGYFRSLEAAEYKP